MWVFIYIRRTPESAIICKSNRLRLKCNDVSIISSRANASLNCCSVGNIFDSSLILAVGCLGENVDVCGCRSNFYKIASLRQFDIICIYFRIHEGKV